MRKFVITTLSPVTLFIFSFLLQSSAQAVSQSDVNAIYSSIAGKHPYTINGPRATYYENDASWTIVGANAPIAYPTAPPSSWPVKGTTFDVLVIAEPITNYKILPFTQQIENAVKTDTISITAARGQFESASFVIRSGDKALKDVSINACDLKTVLTDSAGKQKIVFLAKKNIDVKVVKCWYQAGIEINDISHKTLTPELLLHDDDIVRVDYDKQVNIIKNFNAIRDSFTLKPFTVPERQNKQIWVNIFIPSDTAPGIYAGFIKISCKPIEKILKVKLNVLPYTLPKPMLDYDLYYLSKLSPGYTGNPSGRYKSEEQIYLDFKNMVDYGIENFVLWTDQLNCRDAQTCNNYLQLVLPLRKKAGITTDKPLMIAYDINSDKWLDQTGVADYSPLFSSMINAAHNNGIQDVLIHAKDEVNTSQGFQAEKPYIDMIRTLGAKTFASGWLSGFLKYASNYFDLFLVNGMWGFPDKTGDWAPPTPESIKQAKQLGFKILLYGYPQGGLEMPETYRINYGLDLWMRGFSGECTFAYQSGDYPWDDFSPTDYVSKYRTHNMAYPTMNLPVSTVQWEGFREGIDDVRYITLLLEKGINEKYLIQELSFIKTTYERRKKMISYLMSN